MPTKYNLLPKTTFSNPMELDSVAALLLTHAKITRTQYAAIMQLCAGGYPVTLEIDQRMMKQMLYISKNGVQYQLNNRAKLQLVREND